MLSPKLKHSRYKLDVSSCDPEMSGSALQSWCKDLNRPRSQVEKHGSDLSKNYHLGRHSIDMNLPNGNQAEISIQKLIGYCLNPEHPSGKHKARVFNSRLGITANNVDTLRELI